MAAGGSQAAVYNDSSVLENFHAALGLKLLSEPSPAQVG